MPCDDFLYLFHVYVSLQKVMKQNNIINNNSNSNEQKNSEQN